MTGQLGRLEKLEQGGLSRTKQLGRLKKLGQGLTRVEPNLEGWKRGGKEPPVEPSSFERLRGARARVGPSRTKTAKRQYRNP